MPQLLCPELVGREVERAALLQTLDAAQAGYGAVVFLSGEPGMGKSRLAREAATTARARGFAVLSGRAVEGGTPSPYRPLSEALLGAFRFTGPPLGPDLAPFRGALGQLVPDWREAQGAPEPGEVSPVLLGEGVLRLLFAIGGPRGALLTLEDIHWADQETLAVIEYLADNCANLPVVCLATLRSEPSPAATLARSLAARRAVTSLELNRLSDEETRDMVRACLAAAPPELATRPRIEEAVVERAEGVPFFVEELLATAGAPMTLDLERAVPASFADALDRRLEALGPAACRVLRMAAVLGRRFDWTLLPAATGLDEEHLLAALRAAVSAQLVIAEGGSSAAGFRFRHSLTRDAILAELLPRERALLAHQALTALETVHPDLPGEWCELAADLSETGGDRQRAASLLLRSGRRALRRGALATAEDTLRRARELAEGDTSLGLEADEAMLETLALAGKTDAAFDVGERLLTTAPARRRADIHLRLARAAIAATRWDTAAHHLTQARAETAAANPGASIDALLAQVAMGQGRLEDAVHFASTALANAERLDQTDVACEALEVLGRRERMRDLDRAEELFERARVLAEGAGSRVWRIRALHELATIRMLRDIEVDRLLEARALAYEAGALALVATLDLQLASTWLYRFEARHGLEAAQLCVVAARKYRLDRVVPSALLIESACHAVAGRRGEMEVAAAEALRLAGGDPEIEGGVWLTARGMYAVLQEDRERAVQALDRGMQILRRAPTLPYPVRGLWALLRTVEGRAAEGEDAQREVRASGVTVLPVNQGLVGYAHAVSLGRAGDARGAAAAVEAADALLAGRPGTHSLRWLGLRWVSEAALADGWGRPVEWLTEAAAYFELIDKERVASACRGLLRRSGVTVPRRDARIPEELRRAGVTAREAEVLALLGERLSNREISERLVLSPRTVEKHVERLMAKTQTTSRAELATLAREHLRT